MLGLLFPRTTLPFGTLPCMDLNAIFILAPSKFVLLAQNCSKFHSSIPNALLTPSFAHGKYEKVSQTCSYLPCANGLLTACPQICHHHLFTPLPLAPVFTILDMESYRFLPFLTPTPTYYNPTKSLLTWAPKCILGPLTFLLVRTTAISCVAAALWHSPHFCSCSFPGNSCGSKYDPWKIRLFQMSLNTPPTATVTLKNPVSYHDSKIRVLLCLPLQIHPVLLPRVTTLKPQWGIWVLTSTNNFLLQCLCRWTSLLPKIFPF